MSGIFLNILGGTFGSLPEPVYSLDQARWSGEAYDGTDISIFNPTVGAGAIKFHQTVNPLVTTSFESAPLGCFWSPDGLYLYVIGSGSDTVDRLTSNLADASSRVTSRIWYQPFETTIDGDALSVTTYDTFPRCICLSTDGLNLYVGGDTNDKIYHFTLSTAWTVASATYNGELSVINGIRDIKISPDGTKIFAHFANTNAPIYQWELSTAYDITTAGTPSSFNTGFSSAALFAFNQTGTRLIAFSTGVSDYQVFSLSTAWDVTSASTLGGLMTGVTGVTTLSGSPNLVNMTTVVSASDYVVGNFGLGGFYNPTQGQSGETNLEGVCFNSDGTKIYFVGATLDTVYQYSLPAPYSTYSMTYDGSASISGSITAPLWMRMGDDDNSLYIMNSGATPDAVVRFSLDSGTPGDITSGLTQVSSNGFNIGSDLSVVPCFQFDPTGSYIFVLNVRTIYRFSLSTAWDTTTMSYDSISYALPNGTPDAFCFSDNGENLYINDSLSGVDYIWHLTLGTAWDVSTASWTSASCYANMTNNMRPHTAILNSSTGQLWLNCFIDGTNSVVNCQLVTNNYYYEN